MNDETREQLSAYLDGALPEAERRALEARLVASAELRGALEDLRAVSRAVKNLPKEPLPSGFLVRFQARRARGEAPRQDWVFLPPMMRPVAAALSCGVIALMIWNKVAVSPETALLHPPDAAKVYDAANAPASQLDLTRGGASDALKKAADAQALDIGGALAQSGDKGAAVLDRSAGSLDGSPAAAPVRARSKAMAPGRSLTEGAASAETPLTDRTLTTMSEEERSARNEQMFADLEKQKKSLGMKVLPKDGSDSDRALASAFGLRKRAVAPLVSGASPTLLQPAAAGGLAAAGSAAAPAAAGPGRLAPDAGLVLTDARGFSSTWVLLGLPGDPPAADFANGRVAVIKPSATKILSVTAGPAAVTVVYRSLLPDEASDPARDRVAPIPLEPRSVLIYDASPR